MVRHPVSPSTCRFDSTARVLIVAGEQARHAARACHAWENGGEPDAVTDTAAIAREAASVAIEAVVSDEPLGDPLDEPLTRRGRLAYAGWLAVLAGADEHGESGDLLLAGQLFDLAARA